MLAVRMEAKAAAEPVSSSTYMDMAKRSMRFANGEIPRPAMSRAKLRVREGLAVAVAVVIMGSNLFER